MGSTTTALIILLLVGLYLGYEGYLGPSIQHKIKSYVDPLLAGRGGSGTEIYFVSPDPNIPMKIGTGFSGEVAMPIDVVIKPENGSIVTLTFEKPIKTFSTFSWEWVSNTQFYVKKETIEEARKNGIQISVIPVGGTRWGFKITFPENYKGKFEFVGLIRFYVEGTSLKRILSSVVGGGTESYKLAFVARDVYSNKDVAIPIYVKENSVVTGFKVGSTEIDNWIRANNLVRVG